MKTNKQAKYYLLILTFTLILTTNLTAQVTIGSSQVPDQDALLDIKEKEDNSSTKGLLLPRVELTSTTQSTPLSRHVAGMTVYNTSTVNDVTSGYYYNNGSKWVKLGTEGTSVIPKFFYMPSILLPTDISDTSDASYMTYDPGTQTFSINLYKLYAEQFGMSYLNASAKSPNATTLPILDSSDFEFFITYYDNTVFQNVAIDNSGILTYKLPTELTLTEKTFMNIVFKVK